MPVLVFGSLRRMCAILSLSLRSLAPRPAAERAASRKSQCCASLRGARTCSVCNCALWWNISACVHACICSSAFVSARLGLPLFFSFLSFPPARFAFPASLLSIFAPSACVIRYIPLRGTLKTSLRKLAPREHCVFCSFRLYFISIYRRICTPWLCTR